MINIKSLSKSYGEKNVLKGITLSISMGECVFVLGKSGVGKSVLLRHIVGLEEPDQGTVEVGGILVDFSNKESLKKVRKKCGLIFQFPALLDSVNVFENVCFGLKARGDFEDSEKYLALVYEKIQRVGLDNEVVDMFPSQLNFSLQKKVSIARALAVQPDYLLFDEPTTGLDPISTHGLNLTIQNLSREVGMSCVVVSHDIKSALSFSDRIILLEGGVVVFDGKPKEFRNCSADLAKKFLIGVNKELFDETSI